jgi:hypothetical protein
MVEIFPFSFLEAYDIAVAFVDSLPYVIPSSLGINPSNILIKYIPAIH